ncbi:Peptide exporter [Forsythia ovata]|uniref:Peptide exporter n=1 Tax=Forsythia ovata TaxID=205694 RepID=A0ABD1PFF4_9LAMI
MKDGRITQDGKYNDILKSGSDFMELVGAHKEALSALDSIEAGAAVVGEDSSTGNAKNFMKKKESPTDQNDKTDNAMGTNGQLIQAINHFTFAVVAVVDDFSVGNEIMIPSQLTRTLSFFVFSFLILTSTLVSSVNLSSKFLFSKLDFNGETSVPLENGDELEITAFTLVTFWVAWVKPEEDDFFLKLRAMRVRSKVDASDVSVRLNFESWMEETEKEGLWGP